jgi:hypothetical protein
LRTFTGPVSLTQVGGANWRLWRLNEPLRYEVERGDCCTLIEVPAGFVTDGPTIPRPLWPVLPVFGPYLRCGILHDYLCYRLAKGEPHPDAANRLAADRLFLEALGAVHANCLARLALYAGVRIGAVLNIRTRAIVWNAPQKSGLLAQLQSAS